MAISKIIYKSSPSATPVTWMDATPATAAAADITSPKTAMLANGVVTTGTGTGGGMSVTTETLANGGLHYIISGASGGASYYNGSITPASNSLEETFDIEDSSYNHFLIWATSNPYGNGVRVSALGFVDFSTTIQMNISSNSTGASSASSTSWGDIYCYSKSGSTVTVSSSGSNAAHFNYFIAGVTYNWIAW